jgi:hypothetical protein
LDCQCTLYADVPFHYPLINELGVTSRQVWSSIEAFEVAAYSSPNLKLDQTT